MFTNDEAKQLTSRLLLILEKSKAGKADARPALAQELTDATRVYLKGRYNANLAEELKPKGIYQTRDTITPGDFGK